MKRVRQSVLTSDTDNSTDISDLEEHTGTLWYLVIKPSDTMEESIKKEVMDDYAERLWEYVTFFPQTNSEFFNIVYSHCPERCYFQPYHIYILTTTEHINNVVQMISELDAKRCSILSEGARISVGIPRRATMREISFFSKT